MLNHSGTYTMLLNGVMLESLTDNLVKWLSVNFCNIVTKWIKAPNFV